MLCRIQQLLAGRQSLLLYNLVVDADVLSTAGTANDIDTVLQLWDGDDIVLPTTTLERVLFWLVLVGFRRELFQRDVLSYPRSLGLGHITTRGGGKVLSVELFPPAGIGEHRTGFIHENYVDGGYIARSSFVGMTLPLSVSAAGKMKLKGRARCPSVQQVSDAPGAQDDATRA